MKQVYPSLLEKRDRGKSADLLLTPNAFGQKSVPNSVPGIELLANNEDNDSDTSDDESGGFESGSDDEDDHIEDEGQCVLSDEEDCELNVIKESSDDEGDGETDVDSDIQSIESDMSGDEAKESETDDDGEDESRSEDQTHLVSSKGHELKRRGSDNLLQPEPKRKKRDGIDMGGKECSLRELKKLVTSVSEKSTPQPSGEDGDGILSDADFMRIKKLQVTNVKIVHPFLSCIKAC
jgi:protein SDA1